MFTLLGLKLNGNFHLRHHTCDISGKVFSVSQEYVRAELLFTVIH